MKRLLLTALLLLIPTLVQAQTTTLAWDYLATIPATVATYTQIVRVDGVAVTTAPVCVARGSDTECKVTLGPIANGNRVFTVSASLDGTERIAQLMKSFPLTGGPTQPTNPKFTVTVIITFP